jgi:peptidoglycan L-alanyl-D-glutamate endopeptidase CwlK
MTFALGAKSLANLDRVHPDLIAVVRGAITVSTQDFGVTEPQVRTLAYQQKLVDRGVSKTLKSNHIEHVDRTGHTNMLYGHAVDLVPWINGAFSWDWAAIYRIAAAMAVSAQAHGVLNQLCWGGVWDLWMSQYMDGHMDAATAAAAERSYCLRHPGPDFVDGPHFELYIKG